MPHYHDPREFVRGLQQVLVSDSKKIGLLAGAGTSMVKQRPDGSSLIMGTVDMTKHILDSLNVKYGKPLKAICDEIVSEKKKANIENIISKITQKEYVVGNEKLCGLTKTELKKLREEIEKLIKDLVSVHGIKDFHQWDLVHYKFSRWINDATRKNCIELFTTNYDYLFEIALERFDIPYFDGFLGSFKPFFHSTSVEDDNIMNTWTKLWKIHGSLGWQYDDDEKKIIKGAKDAGSIVVYPSILKYDKSKKQPFVSYLDRLSRFIRHDDSVLFISGYAFGDDHINDAILNGLSKSKTSSVIVFLFDDFKEDDAISHLAKNQTKLSVYGKRNAVIGGKFGQWKLKTVPSEDEIELLNSYYQRDMLDVKDISGKVIGKSPDFFGDFILVDFIPFVEFLSELNYLNYSNIK